MNFIKLTKSPLSVEDISQLVSDASCGAISLFVGTTRDNFEGKSVHRLEYEAYNAMAEKEIEKICQECRTNWNINKIAIHHRLGVVNVKEASIVIAVSSEHRKESLAAVSFLIDTLKASVPIWKKEIYSDNGSEWKQNKECSWIKKENFEEVLIKEEPLSDDSDHEIVEMKVFPDLNFPKRNSEEDRGFSKRRKMNPTFVQINATQHEMERRINAFQERKREELNILNIQQFCVNGIGEGDCARSATMYVKSGDSSSHVKVTKVNNSWGPLTSIINGQFGSSVQTTTSSNIPDGHEERLVNLERHLQLKSSNVSALSIYARLTAIEKRVLFLEGLSPEYFDIPKRRCSIAYEELEDEDDNCDFNKDSLSDSDEEDLEEYMTKVFGDGENVTLDQMQQEIDRLRVKIKRRYPHYI